MSVDWVYTVLSLDAESYYYCHLFSLTPLGRQTFVASPEFQRLKQRLAESFPNDISSYTDGKDSFIHDLEMKAATWLSARGNEATY